MPSTESRSREEWLAEVQRRGTRIRRRRRIGFGVVGAFALVLPVSVTATVLRGGTERAVQVSVAGPAPAGGDMPTTTEVHRRVAVINGSVVESTPTKSVPPADDPVVERPTTTMAPVATSAATARPTPANDTLAVCPAELLQVDVVPTRATFLFGDTVRGVNFIQTRTATDCLVPLPASFRIEEVGTGRVIGTVAAVTEFPNHVRAQAGKMYTSGFSWDPTECAGSTCTQVPPGLYQAVAQWTGGVAYRGWGEFQIGA